MCSARSLLELCDCVSLISGREIKFKKKIKIEKIVNNMSIKNLIFDQTQRQDRKQEYISCYTGI